MRKILFALFIVLSFFASSIHSTFASDYFSRDYKLNYTVKEDGKTNVTIVITLTNKTSDYYAASDTLSVGFNDVQNLSDRDPDGPIKPVVTKTDQGTNIQSTFNKKAVGSGKSITYTINFDTTDIAQKSGKVWEINIPGLSDPNSIDTFSTEVKVPESFGEPSYVKPPTKDNKLVFTKKDLNTSAISIAYGVEQIYSFNVVYHLRNRNLYPIKTEIALPPNTNYQTVEITSISPKPKDVIIDKDGNWLAQFELAPSANSDVQVVGKTKLTHHPSHVVLSAEEVDTYTKNAKYWEVSNPQIKSLAKELRTPKAIYDYVVKTLHYDFNRVTKDEPRLGAVGALANPNSAVCLEFTDLFIALSRAAGIPAREVNGYAYTENAKQRPLSLLQDVLHAWPEYYDKDQQAWIMVDPTWGNTTGGTDYFSTFDLDHIAFVIKGTTSEYPIPAGGYKYAGDEKKKDVNVTFSSTFTNEVPQIKLSSKFPAKALSALPIEGTVYLSNAGSVLFPETTAVLTSSVLYPVRQEIPITAVPPYGTREINLAFDKTPLLSDRNYDFTFNLQGTIIHKSIRVTPIIFSRYALLGGVLIAIFTISLFIIAYKTRRLPLFRQK